MFESFREILVFVAGSTPQIITETIYALAQKSPAIYPDEIFIITTATGKRRILESLVTKEILEQMCAEYNLPQLTLTDDSFIVIRDASGNDLDDIRSVADNDATGDIIAQFFRKKSSEPNCRLHCSIAGGRKSMSYYMGVAFQFFARQWDKLYHVLVSPEFEGNEHFFYKPKVNKQIEAKFRTGATKYLDTDDAEISLVELPLISLRDRLSINSGNLREMVATGQKVIDSAVIQQPLRVSVGKCRLSVGNKSIKLPPAQLMIYVALLRRKLKNTCDSLQASCQECNECFVSMAELANRSFLEEMAVDYQKMHGDRAFKKEELLDKWKFGMEENLLWQKISKINGTIKKHLNDPALYSFYEIVSVREYAASRYGLRLKKENILFD